MKKVLEEEERSCITMLYCGEGNEVNMKRMSSLDKFWNRFSIDRDGSYKF